MNQAIPAMWNGIESVVEIVFDEKNLKHQKYVLSLVLEDFKRIYDVVELDEIDENNCLITFSFNETI